MNTGVRDTDWEHSVRMGAHIFQTAVLKALCPLASAANTQTPSGTPGIAVDDPMVHFQLRDKLLSLDSDHVNTVKEGSSTDAR